MSQSSDVSSGDAAAATDYNDLRKDAIRQIAMAGSALTISGGIVTVDPDAGEGYYTVDTEASAAQDDLDTINGGETGDIIVLHGANSLRQVRLTSSGNIETPAGLPLVLHNRSMAILRWDGADWEVMAGHGKIVPMGGVLGALGAGPIPSGSYVDIPWVPDHYIHGYYVAADQSGSVNLDILTGSPDATPTATIIDDADDPSLVTAQFKSSTTLTDWTRFFNTPKAYRFETTNLATSIEQLSFILLVSFGG